MNTSGQLSVLVAHPGADLYGSDRVLLETIDGLRRSGARVLVALPASGPLVPELERRGAAVILSPTPVLRKSMLSAPGMLRLAGSSVHGMLRSVGVIRGARPDVILANTVTVPLWTAAGRLTGVPVVTHVHEAEANASRALRAALALPLLLSRSILTNSRFSADTLAAALPALRGRATVVYNGVPGPAEPVPPREDLAGGLRILYLGRLSHRKGVDVAVDARCGSAGTACRPGCPSWGPSSPATRRTRPDSAGRWRTAERTRGDVSWLPERHLAVPGALRRRRRALTPRRTLRQHGRGGSPRLPAGHRQQYVRAPGKRPPGTARRSSWSPATPPRSPPPWPVLPPAGGLPGRRRAGCGGSGTPAQPGTVRDADGRHLALAAGTLL